MKHTLIILCILFISGCGIKNWNKRDQILYGTYATLHTVDIFQTRYIKEPGSGYNELNPMLDGVGQNEATAIMVGGYLVTYLLAEYIPSWRTEILIGSNVLSGICVVNNHSIGVGFEF